MVALSICAALRLVQRSVDFDHQARGMAVEVYDEAVDDLLPAKVQAAQPVAT